jgi:HSP20 family protein
MIERHDPFGRTMGLRQMMDRLLEDAFVSPRGLAGMMGAGGPPMDVYEEGDQYVVEAQVPGLKPENLDISIVQGVVTISGESKAEQEGRERKYLIREQQVGRFSRSLRLPENINADAVQAKYADGILRLALPKAEEARPRRIPIGSGGQQAVGGGQAGRPGSTSQTGESRTRGRASS